MKQAEKIICPKCCYTQSLDIYDFTDPGDTKGSFAIVCEKCEVEFRLNFEFKPYIEERLISE